jgi:perosamine synthetase
MSVVKDVVNAVKTVLPKRRAIGHHEAWITTKETTAVAGCLARGVTDDAYVKKFQDKIREITGAEHVVPTSCGTTALELAIKVILPPGSEKVEVLIPSVTFVATANAVVSAGAVPHFLDGVLSLSAYKLRRYLEQNSEPKSDGRGRLNKKTGRTIHATIPVHLLGLPADIINFTEVAHSFGLMVIEDAAQALGSTIAGKHCGRFGEVGILSFNNNKIVTTNGGGAIITDDPWIAAQAYNLSTTARVPHPWFVAHDAIAHNYRLGNINAALGVGQLERFDEIMAAKRRLATRYRWALADINGCRMVDAHDWDVAQPIVWNNWLNTIMVDRKDRDPLLTALHAEGIQARAMFNPLHTLPMYKDYPRNSVDMREAVSIFEQAVCLPSGAGLMEEIENERR